MRVLQTRDVSAGERALRLIFFQNATSSSFLEEPLMYTVKRGMDIQWAGDNINFQTQLVGGRFAQLIGKEMKAWRIRLETL